MCSFLAIPYQERSYFLIIIIAVVVVVVVVVIIMIIVILRILTMSDVNFSLNQMSNINFPLNSISVFNRHTSCGKLFTHLVLFCSENIKRHITNTTQQFKELLRRSHDGKYVCRQQRHHLDLLLEDFLLTNLFKHLQKQW